MAYQLTIQEMASVLEDMGRPEDLALIKAAEALGTAMALHIAKRLNVKAKPCTFDVGIFASPFWPENAGDPIPKMLSGFDSADCWGEE